MVKLLQPQEIEVFYVIPGIKRNLAIGMKNSGMKQTNIAQILQIESATVSQYIRNKRGARIQFNQRVMEEIEKSSHRIIDSLSYLKEMQRIIRLVRDKDTLCEFHKKVSNVPKECNPELIGCFTIRKNGKYTRI
jgi:predicted transcriptional regulator